MIINITLSFAAALAEVMIKLFLVKFACVNSTLISKQCVCMDPGVCIQSDQ